MEMSVGKTEGDDNFKFKIKEREYNFENVSKFKYLEVTLTNRREKENKIDKRLLKGCRAIGTLTSILKAKNISIAAKVRNYETITRPTVI